MTVIALLILHGLLAVALLGAITHQTLAVWTPARQGGSLLARFRGVRPATFSGAVVALYVASAITGAVIYLDFSVEVKPILKAAGYWNTLGVFEMKEHFAAIGMALLFAYWIRWRDAQSGEGTQPRAVTLILAVIVWTAFLSGHIVNNAMGMGDVSRAFHP